MLKPMIVAATAAAFSLAALTADAALTVPTTMEKTITVSEAAAGPTVEWKGETVISSATVTNADQHIGQIVITSKTTVAAKPTFCYRDLQKMSGETVGLMMRGKTPDGSDTEYRSARVTQVGVSVPIGNFAASDQCLEGVANGMTVLDVKTGTGGLHSGDWTMKLGVMEKTP
ncbi:hypothetical protein HED96_004777 [Salmonella enterica]|nr:hypothetical protein [Salmonella enterica]